MLVDRRLPRKKLHVPAGLGYRVGFVAQLESGMSDVSHIDDHGRGRYCYRGFRIVIRGDQPTVALVTDPLTAEETFGPIVRHHAEEALCRAMSVIDARCRDEAADVAEHFLI